MPNNRTATSIVLIAMLSLPPQAFGWGNEGHRLVGDIAEAALAADTAVLQRLHTLFGPAFHLRDIATCADRIRDFVRDNGAQPLDADCAPLIAKFSAPAALLTTFKHSDKWHFINIPLNGQPHSQTDVRTFCGPNLCAPDRIVHYHDTLAVAATPTAQAEAVLFLAHLVGDIHQPLHSVVRNNDAGGNPVLVQVFGQTFGLHHVWDDEIILRMTDEHGHAIGTETARSHHLVANLPAPGTMDPWQWGLDAFALAANTAYVNHGATPAGAMVPDVRTGAGTPLHDKEYLGAADPVVQRQLRLAGVRLAAILREKLNH